MNLSDVMRAPRREDWRARIGAHVEGRGTRFAYRIPRGLRAAIHLYDGDGHAIARHPLVSRGRSQEEWRETFVDGVTHGALYKVVIEDRELPDPWARALPFGVHGPAMVCEARHAWRYGPVTRPLREQVIYELHVGAFTPEGTYAAAQKRLGDLLQLGTTTLALLQTGDSGGYAPSARRGTPDDLRAFIDHAHGLGLSVLMDVVCNQAALAAWCDPDLFSREAVERYVVDHARYWVEELRCDGVRVREDSDPDIVREVVAEVRSVLPGATIVAEEARKAPALFRAGVDAVRVDDLERQLRVAMTRERHGHGAAQAMGASGLAHAIECAALDAPGQKTAAEQVLYGIDNLWRDVSLDAYCAASLLLLMLPMTPRLVMGQEWASSLADADPLAKLRWDERTQPHHARVLSLYRTALAVRRFDPVLRRVSRKQLRAEARDDVLVVRMEAGEAARIVVGNFGGRPVAVDALDLPLESAVLMSSRPRPLAPMSTTVFACSTRRAG